MPAEGWNSDGNYSSSRLGVQQEGRSRQIPPSPPSRSGTLQSYACRDCAPCADCRRKPTVREKVCRGTRKPHPQRARQREQGGVVHRSLLTNRQYPTPIGITAHSTNRSSAIHQSTYAGAPSPAIWRVRSRASPALSR